MSELVLEGRVVAKAGVNIALIKYWGKAPARGPLDANLPAVPSLSLTLDGLGTTTAARLAPELSDDRVVLDGVDLDDGALARCRPVLDRVRQLADLAAPFDIASENTVPTAAGLASSASGMAALAAAASRCAGLDLTPGELSSVARLGSGSACRSVFGGWAVWEGRQARALAPPDHWDLALVVAVIDSGPKKIASRAAMARTASTSPLYPGWVGQARGLFDEAVAAVERRDLEALIDVMEASTLRMHASGMGARPPVLYWTSASLAAIEVVGRLRQQGLLCGWTMDAGPNVKVLCRASDSVRVRNALASTGGIGSTLTCRPGRAVSVRVEPR